MLLRYNKYVTVTGTDKVRMRLTVHFVQLGRVMVNLF